MTVDQWVINIILITIGFILITMVFFAAFIGLVVLFAFTVYIFINVYILIKEQIRHINKVATNMPNCTSSFDSNVEISTNNSINMSDLNSALDSDRRVKRLRLEEIENLFNRLVLHRRNLSYCLLQEAKMGTETGTTVSNSIYFARKRIYFIKLVLRTQGIEVPNHPDDEDISIS